ncbi:MAG: FHA domain-containing protein, partial [Planctomycetota bacterium]
MALDRTNPLESEDSRRRPARGKAGAQAGRTTSYPPSGSSHSSAAAGELKVEVEIGGNVEEVHTFGPGEVHVGRRSRNDITIDGKGLKVVSNYHLRFIVEGGQWCVDDRDSTNGTFLNQFRVETIKPLRDGDTIDLGSPLRSPGGSGSAVRLRVSLQNQAAAKGIEPVTIDSGPTKSMTTSSLAPPNSALEAAMGGKNGVIPAPSEEETRQPDLSATTGPHTILADLDDTDERPRVAEAPKESKVSLGGTMASPPLDVTAPADASSPAEEPEAPTSATVRSAEETTSSATVASADEGDGGAPKVPAERPTELRALLESIREKSRRLGEVGYRLDAHTDDLAAAIVERHAALGVADVPAGAEVIASISKQEQLEGTLAS